MALRVLLTILGGLMTVASRWGRDFRRQLSRDVVIEIRSDDGVARHFVFHDRRAWSRAGRAEHADCSLHFASARQGFSVLSAKDGPVRLYDGILEGTIRIEGNVALFSWFSGLVQAVMPGVPRLRLPATPPDAYLKPSSSPEVSRFISREPAERELDPSWTSAARARKKLAMMRVAGGERPKRF